MRTMNLGYADLNDRAKLKVAEFYGYKTAATFEANENYGIYLDFEVCLDDDGEDDDGEDIYDRDEEDEEDEEDE